MSTTILALTPRPVPNPIIEADPGYRLLSAAERLSKRFSRCLHNYSWPLSITRLLHPIAFPAGYNSYQTCTHCGTHRFYDARTMTPGPLFVRSEGARRRSVA